MLQLQHYSFQLAFEYPFTIAKGTKTEQASLVVSLGLRHWRGYGEAPAISYYGITVPDMIAELHAKRLPIERYALTDPKRFWHFLHHLFPQNSFLAAALDIAAWDLFAQMRNLPLRRVLGISSDLVPLCDYTIGMDNKEQMIAKLQQHPWPIYKIKFSQEQDLDTLIALRAHTEKPFRIDANEGLSFETTKALLPEFEKLGVTLLEQPLPKTEWEAMQELRSLTKIPLFADESCVDKQDLIKCAASFDGINIKLTKCGGITPALDMIEEARRLGLKIMLGTMNEASIGTAAMVQIAPLADELDADGPLLLREDVSDGLQYKEGSLSTLAKPGLGIRFLGKATERTYF